MLAAGDTPEFLGPVVVFLITAALIGYVAVRLRVVPIVGFLLAGVAIGPAQLGLVGNEAAVGEAAEIGVLLLLFTLGIEFSLERLGSIRRYVVLGGGLQVAGTLLVTCGIVMALGEGWRDGVFTGFLVALSSTAIVLKVLAAAGRTTRPPGQAAVAVLIFQDLVIVLMVLLVPLLGGEDSGPWALAEALGTALAVIAVVLIVARRVMPIVLEWVARACSPEVFLLTVIAIALGTAWLTSKAGVSVSLGAFLAGLIVSESRHSSHALGEVLPLQILFSATFFVSIGMLLDLGFVADNLLLIAVLAVIVVAIKAVTGTVALAVLRLGLPTALGTAFLLAQIGEFSFVLQQSADGTSLTPAGLGEDGAQALITVTVLLMALTPALSSGGDWLGRRLGMRMRRTVPAAGPPEEDGQRGALISGWGPVAEEVAHVLRYRGIPVTVTTLSPDLAAAAEQAGHNVVTGDPVKRHVLEEAGAAEAELVLITENEAEDTARIAEVVRMVAPKALLVVRAVDEAAADLLTAAGADRVIDGTRGTAERVTWAVLRGLGESAQTYPDTSLVVDFQPENPCPHTSEIRLVLPKSPGCTECLRQGRHDWVHLRTCLTCGYVGCCDSSPQRHARAHHNKSEHPIVASAEPGEDWAWCFLCEEQLEREP